jgi:transcriptional regulator with XRE-family HTH domain
MVHAGGPRVELVPEIQELGLHLMRARIGRGLSQSALAEQCSLSQAQISYFELGVRLPALDQLVRIARALDVPIQRFFSGTDRPGNRIKDMAVELRRLGMSDLWMRDALVPGAFRRNEELIALAVSGEEPDPRIVEAIPAALAWNEVSPTLLHAHGIATETLFRLAWLADVTLTIERQKGFPGGCHKQSLERFLKSVGAGKTLSEDIPWDGLGKPVTEPPASPIWRRWRINYAASLQGFEERARSLDRLRAPQTRRQKRARELLAVLALVRDRKAAETAQEPRPAGGKIAAAHKPTHPALRKPRKGVGDGK